MVDALHRFNTLSTFSKKLQDIAAYCVIAVVGSTELYCLCLLIQPNTSWINRYNGLNTVKYASLVSRFSQRLLDIYSKLSYGCECYIIAHHLCLSIICCNTKLVQEWPVNYTDKQDSVSIVSCIYYGIVVIWVSGQSCVATPTLYCMTGRSGVLPATNLF